MSMTKFIINNETNIPFRRVNICIVKYLFQKGTDVIL